MAGPVMLVTVLILTVAAPAVGDEACAGLDEAARHALGTWINSQYDTGQKVECGLDLGFATRDLARSQTASACLLDIYYHGLTHNASLWNRKDLPVPTDGKWALLPLRQVDPTAALRVYRDIVRNSAGGSTARVRAQIEVARLGGNETLGELTAVLAGLVSERATGDDLALAIEIAAVLAERDYTSGAATVTKLVPLVPASNILTRVHAAQLSRDLKRLQEYARQSGSAPHALDALLRIGRRDLVEVLAADPRNAFAQPAREALKQNPPKS